MTQARTVSILIHADAKAGKSTLSSTAPGPVLVLDAEGSWKFIKARKVFWDPAREPMPVHDGTWDACMVSVSDWSTVGQVYQWLASGQHPFRSVVIDSITEIQRILRKNLKGTDAMQIQDWGMLLTQMDVTFRQFRDLSNNKHNPVECVVFIAETKESSGKWRPFMQGQIATFLPYAVDICGYLYVDNDPDENGQLTKRVRRLWIGPSANFITGERVGGSLGDVVTNPNIANMITQMYDALENNTVEGVTA